MKDSKKIKLIISSIIKKMDRYAINFEHRLQRPSGMWTPLMKGNLISDILQDNPIPDLVFAEQNIHDAPTTWGIDGKQRCTSIRDFYNNLYSISKNIDRYMIEYPVPVLDENGAQLRDDEGILIHRTEVCDIRGKKFKTLPKELQERFLDYGFDIVLYYDCTEENLAYHIKRYNEGRPMNPAQKGLTRLGVHFANKVSDVSSMPFFEDGIGDYKASQFKNGTIDRVIVESVMTAFYLDDWTKDYADVCEFVKNNATDIDFDNFKELVERLENVDEPVGKMFDSKNSLLYFGLYARFVKLGLEDERFNEFMLELRRGLYDFDEDGKIVKNAPMTGICIEEINGETYESILANKSTKDVSVVKKRIDFLTDLMCDYLGVEMPEDNTEDNTDDVEEFSIPETETELTEFAQNFVSDELAMESLMLITNSPYANFRKDTLGKMIEWYKNDGYPEQLNSCLDYKTYVCENIGIEEDDINLPLYIYAIQYIYESDMNIDIDDWFNQFKDNAFTEIDSNPDNIPTDNQTIALKQSEIIQNIKKFIKENDEL